MTPWTGPEALGLWVGIRVGIVSWVRAACWKERVGCGLFAGKCGFKVQVGHALKTNLNPKPYKRRLNEAPNHDAPEPAPKR